MEELLKASATNPATDPADVGAITTVFTTTSAEGQRLKAQLETKIRERLHQLTPPLDGEHAPQCVQQLRNEHPGNGNFPALVQAVTAWREVSGQQDAETPWGEPPKTTDKTMTTYYTHARKHLPPAPLSDPDEPEDIWADLEERLAGSDKTLQQLHDAREEAERDYEDFLTNLEPLPEGWEELLTPPDPAGNQHSGPADAGWDR